jgi:hypothetical protein
MSALNQKTIAALRAEMIEAETAEAEEKERLKAEAAATNPPIYSAAFLATLVKQFSAMLAKHQGTITEANAEIDRLKSENALLRKPNNDPLSVDEARVLDDFLGQTALNHAMADYKRLAPLRAVFERRQRDFDSGRPKKVKKDKNVGDDLIASLVAAAAIDDSDSDSDSDVIEVNCVVYNGVTYHREVNSNVLYHPKKHEVVGMWNDGRGRVDVLPINPHED